MLKYPLTYIIYITLFYVLGILSFFTFQNTNKNTITIISIIVLALLIISIILAKKNNITISFFILMISIIFIGYLYTNLQLKNYIDYSLLKYENTNIKAFEAEITAYDGLFMLRERYEAKIYSVYDGDNWHKVYGKIRIYNSTLKKLDVNDKIIVDSEINLYRNIITNEKIVENLENKMIFGVSSIYTYDNISTIKRANSFISYHIYLRNFIKKALSHSVSPIEYSLVQCLVLGDKNIVPQEIKDNFSNAGISHLLAVSGLHLSIIYGVIIFILSSFNISLYKKIIVATLITFFVYLPITFFAVSVVRASIMILCLTITLLFDRSKNTLNGLFLAGLIILLIDANSIRDISFQFSFLATFGIVALLPIYTNFIENKIKTRNKIINNILNYVLVSIFISISANIFIMPLSMYYFSVLNLNSVLSNIFAIPLSFLILITGFLTIFTYVFSPNLSTYFGATLEALTKILINLAEKISELNILKYDISIDIKYSIIITFSLIIITLYKLLLPRINPK